RPISVTRIASAVIVVLAAAALYLKVTGREQLGNITLPNGFGITIYSGAVPNARQMALGDNGTVFVGSMREGNVYALVDSDGDNVAEETYTIASDLTLPSGVAFKDGALYVAALSRILVYDGIESRLANPPQAVVVRDDLPTLTHHGWKFIQFGPDGLLYLAVGMPCNICPESDGPYGAILRMKTDKSDWEIFARGVRNSVGFDWDPRTDELWFTDNGRDMLGDDLPPDELNHAPTAGLHFGFPFCHGGTIADPDYGQRPCSEFTPPAQPLGPHVASIGMRFYSGEMFPPEYHNQIFIAEHGSWNRSTPIGYRITVVRLENNQAVGYDVFAEGWLRGRRPWGRPADVLVMPDGALLVSDDRQGAIYRISYGER
ncbi:MAG: sorbosone dehydrogenase family protein, partial [Gemmatimonadales bacterium]